MFMWGTGDLYFAGVLSERDVCRIRRLADVLWLAFYLPAYAAIYSLLRDGRLAVAGVWLDALIGGLGVGSAGAVVAFGVVLDNTSGTGLATATNLAYPVGDLGLLALVVRGDHASRAGQRPVCGGGSRRRSRSSWWPTASSWSQVAEGSYAIGGISRSRLAGGRPAHRPVCLRDRVL